jgi:hypothetical protein
MSELEEIEAAMITYYDLQSPDSERLMGDDNESDGKRDRKPCPVTNTHSEGGPRVGSLCLQMKHNRRDERIIWGWQNSIVLHESLLGEFEHQRFTGYRVKPATVRFRDGSTSIEYREFIVTGWAGIASPESGVRVDMSCQGCHWKHYSPITNHEKLIDWNQWTGEDFFIVWPLPLHVLITERVAEWLQLEKVKSFRLERLEDEDPFIAKYGFTVGRLSHFLPEDLAIKYGRTLGLE